MSPTDSEYSRSSDKSANKVQEDRVRVCAMDGDDYEDGVYYDDEQSPIVDWLSDSPTDGRYEMDGNNVKRDSLAVYNHLNMGLTPLTAAFRRTVHSNQRDDRDDRGAI